MRAFLDEDYAAHKHTIFMQQSIYARIQPNTHFYVEFDYSRGSARVECKPFMDSQPPSVMPIDWEALRADARARAIRSAGRMELCAMTVQEAGGYHTRFFPMRCRGAEVHDGLRALGQRLPMETDGKPLDQRFADKIYCLECLDVGAFH